MKTRYERTRHLDKATAATFGVPVFHGIRCADCKAGLHNSKGQPRWDVIGSGGRLAFVCQGGCR
ncbi:hypothetical protein OWR29_25460 [Actinoplanes sp. Pm04-4]|uniref:Recombinase zinc beta ribbon domain-containing protein n=1 Tax=Paractinoplanes pyxinae TaxID=2997416 RepID=A0ABT4B6Z4_9ACTN|nr:hypothetical protein [Actinoplanes pyxinae]MCY1141360.1 hypothetical protein [Actinoplanes pyxinae]